MVERNGVKVVYEPDYKDLNSDLAKAFVEPFEKEVIFHCGFDSSSTMSVLFCFVCLFVCLFFCG